MSKEYISVNFIINQGGISDDVTFKLTSTGDTFIDSMCDLGWMNINKAVDNFEVFYKGECIQVTESKPYKKAKKKLDKIIKKYKQRRNKV